MSLSVPVTWSLQAQGYVGYLRDTGDWLGLIKSVGTEEKPLFILELNEVFPPEDSVPTFRSPDGAMAYVTAIAGTAPGQFKPAPPPWGPTKEVMALPQAQGTVMAVGPV